MNWVQKLKIWCSLRLWSATKFISIACIGALVFWWMGDQGDTILKHARGKRVGVLQRVEKYCFSSQADAMTCEMYLEEDALYTEKYKTKNAFVATVPDFPGEPEYTEHDRLMTEDYSEVNKIKQQMGGYIKLPKLPGMNNLPRLAPVIDTAGKGY